MSRLKLATGIVIATLILAALFVVPAMTFAAPAHSDTKTVKQATPTINYYAFNGTIIKGQNRLTSIVGGLTLTIRHSGDFFGKFVQVGKVYQNVNGKVTSGGSWTINFLQGPGAGIAATGSAVSNSELAGTFLVSSGGKQVSSGIWSALVAPGPASQLSMVFSGRVTTGPDSKLDLTGPIILDATSLRAGVTVPGTLNMSDGTVYAVRASVDHSNHIEVNVGVGEMLHVIATGIQFYNGQIHARGYTGAFVGFRQHDSGVWTGTFFNFTKL